MIAMTLFVAASANTQGITVVDVSKESHQTRMAVQVCAGLFNRDTGSYQFAYTLGFQKNDAVWLADIEGITNPTLTPVSEFLARCIHGNATAGLAPVAKGVIRYDYNASKALIPNIVTLAAVLDAVPLEVSDPAAKSTAVVFDVAKEWQGFDYYKATEYMFDQFRNVTTTMAKMNPGYDVHEDPIFPKLTGSADQGLVDYIVKVAAPPTRPPRPPAHSPARSLAH